MIRNVSQFNKPGCLKMFQRECSGSHGVGHAVLSLFATPGATETILLAEHPNDGGRVIYAMMFRSVEVDGRIYVVNANDDLINPKDTHSCPVRVAVNIIRYASIRVGGGSDITVRRVDTEYLHSQAIASAVLSLQDKRSKVEHFEVTSNVKQDYWIGIAKERHGFAYRWCGENFKPDGAGSHSVISGGTFESMKPVFVAAILAERFYSLKGLSLYLEKMLLEI